MRRVVLIVPLAIALAGCGGGSTHPKRSPTVNQLTPTTKLDVVVTAQSHHPKLHHTWWYEVRVTSGGKPVAATIHIQMWFNGASVGEVGRHHVANGIWRETIVATGPNAFPPSAVGQPLVLHATATAKGHRAGSGGWSISVVK